MENETWEKLDLKNAVYPCIFKIFFSMNTDAESHMLCNSSRQEQNFEFWKGSIWKLLS